MTRSIFFSLVLFGFSTSNASALLLGHSNLNPELPFEKAFQQNGQLSFEEVLQLINNSGSTVSVLSWQLEFELRPLPGTVGQLLFHEVTAPPNSLFGQMPGPISDLSTPNNEVLVIDGDTVEFDGEPVLDHSARNILQLTLAASQDAAGTFELITPDFNPENPDSGSSWFETNGVEPRAFENSSPSNAQGFVLLGTIHVRKPGDYDSDGTVDELDYSRWRQDFGGIVNLTGEGADGNQNGLVDAADYVVWRTNLPTASGGIHRRAQIVPEPESLTVVTLVLVSAVAILQMRPPSCARLVRRASDCVALKWHSIYVQH